MTNTRLPSCFGLILGALSIMGCLVAAGSETGLVLRVGLELTDGSYLLGVPAISNLSVKTSYADLGVSLGHISGVKVSPRDGETTVELRNGDRIKGTMETQQIGIDALIGHVLIRREQISAIRVLRGGALDPQFMTGLLLHYTFDSADNLAADSGPSGRHGTVHGAKYAEKGKRNGAADFDGRSSHIRTPVVDNTKDLTWALWVFPRTLGRSGTTIQPVGLKGHAWVWNSDNTCIQFFLDGSGGARMSFEIQGNTEGVWMNSRVADVTGRWVHLAVTVSSSGKCLYVDGKLAARNGDVSRIGSPCSMIIGANDNGPQRHFDGLIDEIMVFDRAISGDEVQQLHDSEK